MFSLIVILANRWGDCSILLHTVSTVGKSKQYIISPLVNYKELYCKRSMEKGKMGKMAFIERKRVKMIFSNMKVVVMLHSG